MVRERCGAPGTWPIGEEIADEVLETALDRLNSTKMGHRRSFETDCTHVHRELRRKRVACQ
ncbi:hypothetical protein AU467_27585 [Mesorhizobium loti]|uniref:Uncharacterized protein n=1 Tax=Rhizobium loti TaxID=381 RepID=A0A101KQD1_RHILI|nr:hypothetical protein AU467_27585 [Mesorhizobium loti]